MIERNPHNHLAFGYGPHLCLGQFIAWIELDATSEYDACAFASGLKRLPICCGAA